MTAQAWLTAANERIDQHRKADLTVQVVDSAGQAVPDVAVHVEMKQHHFGFGTAVPASRINEASANGDMFRAKLLENFNHVVFENDLKWPPWIGLWGPGFNWNNTTSAMDWLDDHDLPIRGHYLSWATWSGSDVWGTFHGSSPPQSVINSLPQRLMDHISEKATDVGHRVFEWDVINHPVGWLNDTYENRLPSGLDFYVDIVHHSRSVVPDGVSLWINEDDIISAGNLADDYERIIQHLVDNDAALDGIGFQGHFIQEWGRSSFHPQSVYNRIDRFAEFGLPLRVTEFDIDVGNDEALQAQHMSDYLTVMFSHPDMMGVTLWGFWAGSHWRPNAALYRGDWSEKPALSAYQDLVLNQWWTDELGTSDELGEHHLRGFQGEYDITVTLDGEEYVLSGVSLEEDTSVLMTLPIVLGLPGDFNSDGVVDAADFTIWRDGLGTTHFTQQYEDWKTNFGASSNLQAAHGPASNATVPEPAGVWLLVVAVFGGAFYRRVRRDSRRHAADLPPFCAT